MAIALAGVGAIALFVGWSLPGGVAADRPAEVAMRRADAGISGATASPADPELATGRARSRVNCAGCGVIESMRRIDTPVALMERCDAGEFAWPRVRGPVFAGGGREEVESLADTVAALVAQRQGMKKVAVTTRHQIVVRFRDGTRHVFDEATPRTLQVGDRIKVIAAAPAANG